MGVSIAVPLPLTWVLLLGSTARHPGRHSACLASVPSPWPAAPTSPFSVWSIIYDLQDTITINNAQAIKFYSFPHNCVTPNICRAGSWPWVCSLLLPQQVAQWLKRRAGLVRLGSQLCPPHRAASFKPFWLTRPQTLPYTSLSSNISIGRECP